MTSVDKDELVKSVNASAESLQDWSDDLYQRSQEDLVMQTGSEMLDRILGDIEDFKTWVMNLKETKE